MSQPAWTTRSSAQDETLRKTQGDKGVTQGDTDKILGLFGPLRGPFFRHQFCRFLLRLFPLVLTFVHEVRSL